MKQKQNHFSTFLTVAGIIVLGLLLTNLVPDKGKRNPSVNASIADDRAALEKTLQSYLAPLPILDDWWILETPPPSAQLAQGLEAALSNVTNAIAGARNASPLTQEIAREFSSFYTSIFENGVSRVTMVGAIDSEMIRDKTEICFFSKREYNPQTFPGLLYYRGDWKAIMAGGIRWSGPLFNGVLYHELYHALNHRKGVSLLTTEKYVKEEAEAHELEIAVIDHMTRGAYRKEAASIVSAYAAATNERELLGKITPEDLFRLDKILGLEGAGQDVRSISTAQNILTIGFHLIDKRGGTADDKAALYRWVRRS